MKMLYYIILFSICCKNSNAFFRPEIFIQSSKTLLSNHILSFTIRQTIYNELFDESTLFKEIYQITSSQFDYIYYCTFSIALLFFIKDNTYNKSIEKLRKNGMTHQFEKQIQFLTIVIMMVLTKNVENAI